jgi:hypothetical protein
VIVVTFFGCCGAIKENKCMLGTYFTVIPVPMFYYFLKEKLPSSPPNFFELKISYFKNKQKLYTYLQLFGFHLSENPDAGLV